MTTDFVPLLNFEDEYEIMVEYPNVIRKTSNQQIVNERIDAHGYVVVSLHSYPYKKHRLIALQFIPNRNNFPQVDHRNHIRTDNRIDNLRWCDNSINNKNRLSYNGVEAQYVDELPENAEVIDEYNGWEFENYYIDHDLNIYYDTGANYRILYKLDKPWYQKISELANVSSLLRGIRNHIYDKKYQTIIQKYSELLSGIFSNENFISGLTTLVDDQDLKNCINDLENLIRRQETDENGNIIEIFPKEAISPEPIDYIECIVLYPNKYPATKQVIKDIVTEINKLPDQGVQNGDLLLTIALIKIWNSGKRWLLPSEVYDTIMEFVKQLQAKKLTDCNALRDEKIFPEVHQMLQTFSNSWGQTKVFWSRQISAELATKQIMIGNTELKQRAQDYTEILLNLQKVENID
ncbi:hypothetical protein M9Y10_036911, partial [Tritrichomonas musculus]